MVSPEELADVIQLRTINTEKEKHADVKPGALTSFPPLRSIFRPVSLLTFFFFLCFFLSDIDVVVCSPYLTALVDE